MKALHSRGTAAALCLSLATLILCSCGKKPEPPPMSPAPPRAGVTVDTEPAAVPPPAPAAVDAPPVVVETVSKAPPVDEDPVTKEERQNMERMNRSLQAFLAKNQRLPNDFNEFARNIDGVPLPPPGKFWVIDAATKTVKLASKK